MNSPVGAWQRPGEPKPIKNQITMREPKYFVVDHYDHGCTGKKITIFAAIQIGAFDVYDDERIKKAYKFGNGTFSDFEAHALMNHQSIFTPEEFWQFALPLGEAWRLRTEGWIIDMLNNRGL